MIHVMNPLFIVIHDLASVYHASLLHIVQSLYVCMCLMYVFVILSDVATLHSKKCGVHSTPSSCHTNEILVCYAHLHVV